MPDGGELELVLVAGNAPGRIEGLPMEGGKQSLRVSFDRGASAADAATSLRDVLNQAITDIRNDPAFEGASLARAAEDFFHEDGPRWVDGGTLQAAGEDEVVHWYRGDDEGDPAGSQLARIAEGTIVDYGVRANQGELRDAIKQTAMIAAIGPYDPSDLDAYRAFAQRAAAGSGRSADAITHVQSMLGVKQELVERVDGQHAEASNLMSRRVAEIEEADPYEVATKLAELQQQLEATYAITGRTQGLSLVNFMT
jgi:flagellin-like hook-associated protein FlgL